MTKIIKEYWTWNEKLNDTGFELGSIKSISDNDITKSDSEGLFNVPDNNDIESIQLVNSRIRSIIISKEVKDFIKPGIWDKEYCDFITEMDEILERTDKGAVAPFLFVAFRGGFMTTAFIVNPNI